jgi:hypothetical protein
MLVGDRTRELGVRALRRHFMSGRLSTAELADRVDLALRARTRSDLGAAMEDLPPVWEDLPAGVHVAAHHARRGVRRVKLFFRVVRVWFKVNLALVLAIGPRRRSCGPSADACAAVSPGAGDSWRVVSRPLDFGWPRQTSRDGDKLPARTGELGRCPRSGSTHMVGGHCRLVRERPGPRVSGDLLVRRWGPATSGRKRGPFSFR